MVKLVEDGLTGVVYDDDVRGTFRIVTECLWDSERTKSTWAGQRGGSLFGYDAP